MGSWSAFWQVTRSSFMVTSGQTKCTHTLITQGLDLCERVLLCIASLTQWLLTHTHKTTTNIKVMGNRFSLLSLSLLAGAVGVSGSEESSAELGGCGSTSSVLQGPRGPSCPGDPGGKVTLPLFQVRCMRFLRRRA